MNFLSNDGLICYIVHNSWLFSDYGLKFQKFLFKYSHILQITDSNFKHFRNENGPNINTIITFLEKSSKKRREYINFVNFPDIQNMLNSITRGNGTFCRKNVLTEVESFSLGLGVFLEVDPTIQKILDDMLKVSLNLPIKIGQGLNIKKENIITKVISSKLEDKIVPFMTSEDGAPFILKGTKRFIIPSSSLDKNDILSLKAQEIYPTEITSYRTTPGLILPRGISRYYCTINLCNAFSSSYVEIYNIPNRKNLLNIWLFLNSSIGWLIREISGRKNLGGGLLKSEATDLRKFPICYDFLESEQLDNILKLFPNEATEPIKEIEKPHHKKIDEIVFSFFKLTPSEREHILKVLKDKIQRRITKTSLK